jgi:RNA-binding protein YhbY
LTDNLIFAVKNAFNAHENVKISVLKAATRSREETEKIA